MQRSGAEKLLKEYVRILAEDDWGGGDYAGLGLDPMAGSPYGMHFASGDQMYKIFVKPFTDVFNVAAGKSKEASIRAQTLMRTVVEGIATTIIPFLSSDYMKIFENEKKNIDKIRSEYAEVYNATWEAFNDNDVLVAAFMYRPDVFLTSKLAEKAPNIAAKLMSILSGGKLDGALKRFISAISTKSKGASNSLRRTSNKLHRTLGGHGGGDYGGGYGDHGFGESVLREDEKKKSSGKNPVQLFLQNDEVQDYLASSPIVQRMSKAGKVLVQGTLQKIVDHASTTLDVKSLTDMQTKFGRPIPGIDRLSKLQPEERTQAEQTLLKSTRDGMKSFYVKQLEGQVNLALKSGVPIDHPYIKDYKAVISRIKGM